MTLKHNGRHFELIYKWCVQGLFWMCAHWCVCWPSLTSCALCCVWRQLFTHTILIIFLQIAAIHFPLLVAACVCVLHDVWILIPSVNLAVPLNSFSIMFTSSWAVSSYTGVCVLIHATEPQCFCLKAVVSFSFVKSSQHLLASIPGYYQGVVFSRGGWWACDFFSILFYHHWP